MRLRYEGTQLSTEEEGRKNQPSQQELEINCIDADKSSFQTLCSDGFQWGKVLTWREFSSSLAGDY